MKTNLRTIIAAAGIGLAAVSVGGVAAAQSYGDADTQGVTAEAEVDDTGIVLDIQEVPDAETDDAESDDAGEEGEREGRRGRRGGCDLDAAAAAIGIDEDELRAELDENTSMADVAEANGVDPATVIDALVAEETDELAEKVEEGRLTQDEADDRLSGLEAEITERVETPGSIGGSGDGERGDRSDRGPAGEEEADDTDA